MSAPISGAYPHLARTIKTTAALVTLSNRSCWRLRSVEREGKKRRFIVEFTLHADHGAVADSMRSMTNMLPSRGIGTLLWEIGLPDMRLYARPRLTTVRQIITGGASDAIASSSGTVMASIFGMAVVATISACTLCVDPREKSKTSKGLFSHFFVRRAKSEEESVFHHRSISAINSTITDRFDGLERVSDARVLELCSQGEGSRQ